MMKYIKRFNESGNTKFDWSFKTTKKQSNERYIDLMYILQSDLFDEYNIISKSGESFDGENYPEHKFWTFRLVGDDVEDSSDNNTNAYITSIIIYNISSEEKDSFLNSLIEIRDKVKDLISKELIIEESKIMDTCYDYIIKLGEEFKFKKDLL